MNRKTAEHYHWGNAASGPCDGWHLVKGDDLSVIEERMPPDTEERSHRHKQARQFFYVLEGELTMELKGESVVLAAGDGLEIEPGATHQAMNRSDADVRFLVISQPAVRQSSGNTDRIEAAGMEKTR